MRPEQAIFLFYLNGRIRRHLLNIEERSDDCRQPIAKLCTEAVLENRRRVGQRAKFGQTSTDQAVATQ